MGCDLFSDLNLSDAAELLQWTSLGTTECEAVAAAPVCSMRREAVRALLHTTQPQGIADEVGAVARVVLAVMSCPRYRSN